MHVYAQIAQAACRIPLSFCPVCPQAMSSPLHCGQWTHVERHISQSTSFSRFLPAPALELFNDVSSPCPHQLCTCPGAIPAIAAACKSQAVITAGKVSPRSPLATKAGLSKPLSSKLWTLKNPSEMMLPAGMATHVVSQAGSSKCLQS